MNFCDLKKYLAFVYLGVCALMTICVLGFSLYMYISWDSPAEQDPSVLEIKLPVMDWMKYSSLSKQYHNGIVKDVLKN
jgi:hypothetical protein